MTNAADDFDADIVRDRAVNAPDETSPLHPAPIFPGLSNLRLAYPPVMRKAGAPWQGR